MFPVAAKILMFARIDGRQSDSHFLRAASGWWCERTSKVVVFYWSGAACFLVLRMYRECMSSLQIISCCRTVH